MVKYLKYIVLVFGSIGIIAGSFFGLQNKQDILHAYNHSDKFDYDYLQKSCHLRQGESIFPCLKYEFEQFLPGVSLTGTSIGLKMIFNLLEEDRRKLTTLTDPDAISFTYSLYHLEINNMAMNNAYQNYFGFSFLYGGFISSLKQYYLKAHRFSQDIITGLEGPSGLVLLKGTKNFDRLQTEFSRIKDDYYRIKKEANTEIDKIWNRLMDEAQKG